MSQGQAIDQHMQSEHLQSQPQLQPQHSSPNMIPSRLPSAAQSKTVPPTSKVHSLPLPEQRVQYGTPSSRRYYPPDHPFAAAIRDVPIPNLEAASWLSRGNSNMSRMLPQEQSVLQGQSIDLMQPFPLLAPRHNTQVLWPNYPPGLSAMPPEQMHSRLPPKGVSRKAPRKSAASNNEALRSETSATPAQRRASKQEYRQRQDTPGRQSSQGETPPAQGSSLHGYHTSIKNLQALQANYKASKDPSEVPSQSQQTKTSKANRIHRPTSARSRRIVLEDDDDDEYVNEDDNENDALPSIEIASTSSPEPPATLVRRSRRLANERSRPRSKYEDVLPHSLIGIQQALGNENWIEYLTLLETKILGNMTEREFTARTKAIFTVFDDEKTATRIEKRITTEIIMPMLEQEQREGGGLAMHD